jgi:hypothetical protein
MIPHFIDLLCRGVSLAALVWGVFSMGFSSAERKASSGRDERSDNSGVEPARASHGFDHHG